MGGGAQLDALALCTEGGEGRGDEHACACALALSRRSEMYSHCSSSALSAGSSSGLARKSVMPASKQLCTSAGRTLAVSATMRGCKHGHTRARTRRQVDSPPSRGIDLSRIRRSTGRSGCPTHAECCGKATCWLDLARNSSASTPSFATDKSVYPRWRNMRVTTFKLIKLSSAIKIRSEELGGAAGREGGMEGFFATATAVDDDDEEEEVPILPPAEGAGLGEAMDAARRVRVGEVTAEDGVVELLGPAC